MRVLNHTARLSQGIETVQLRLQRIRSVPCRSCRTSEHYARFILCLYRLANL